MKKILIALLALVCAPAAAQNYLRDDGIFHSVVEGTTNGQVLINNGGLLGGTTLTSLPLTIGTTSIFSGTTTRILYDNAGVLGEYALTGTGTVVVMKNAPTLTGLVTVTRNATSWPAQGTTSVHVVGDNTGEGRFECTAFNSDCVSVYGRANNTAASSMPLVVNDQVMGLIGSGIDTAGSTSMQQGGALGGFASQDWTPTHHGYYFQFFGINDNTVDIVDFGTFKNQGLALVGGLTTAGVTATPTSGTINKGLAIIQTAPLSGTPTGPVLFNTIDVTNPGLGASGAGHDNFGGQSLIYGVRATMSITGTSSGSGSAAFGAFTNIAAASDGFGGSHGVTITGAGPAGHNAWGHIGYGIVFNGGQIGLLVGVESEMGVSAGATASFRIGHSANSQGPVQGSTLDAAFAANTINIAGFGGNAAPWQHLMALSGSMYSGIGFPLATTGDFFFSDTAGTVANFANLANVTVTGSILKFQNLIVPGAAAGFTLPTPAAGTTFQFGGQDSNSTNIEIDSFGGMARLVARRADGTSTAPTAVQSDESIGIITMRAYDGAAYFQAATAIARAAQNLTGSNHGSYWLFSTIPLNSTIETEVVRIRQGVCVGCTTEPGLGLISINSASFLMRNGTSWTNGAAAALGTLTNAPTAGNPTKWIPIDDNGTTRYLPAW